MGRFSPTDKQVPVRPSPWRAEMPRGRGYLRAGTRMTLVLRSEAFISYSSASKRWKPRKPLDIIACLWASFRYTMRKSLTCSIHRSCRMSVASVVTRLRGRLASESVGRRKINSSSRTCMFLKRPLLKKYLTSTNMELVIVSLPAITLMISVLAPTVYSAWQLSLKICVIPWMSQFLSCN